MASKYAPGSDWPERIPTLVEGYRDIEDAQAPAPWTSERHAEMKALVSRATQGPWKNLRREYTRANERIKRSSGRYYHGSRRAGMPVFLIAKAKCRGEDITEKRMLRDVDRWDLRPIVDLWWSDIPRTTSVTSRIMTDDDADFIAACREAVPAMLAEIERLRGAKP